MPVGEPAVSSSRAWCVGSMNFPETEAFHPLATSGSPAVKVHTAGSQPRGRWHEGVGSAGRPQILCASAFGFCTKQWCMVRWLIGLVGWLVGWWKWRFGLLFCNWIHSLWYFWWFEICNSIFGPLFYIWIGHWWILRIFSYWREFRRMVFVKRNDIDVSWWWNVSWTDQENNFFVGRWEDHGGQPFGEFEDSILRIDGGGWNEHLEELVKLL